jgi:uncharacterized membrane protein
MTEHPNARLEFFCDAVFAIALTLLIIDVRIPATMAIHTSADLWSALGHLLPSIFAFVLSFGIIFINWVNHHELMRLIDKSSHPFIYANGFLMLGIVFVPFPTALLGESLMTSHAAPAVVLYSFSGVIVGIGWVLIAWTALKPRPLTRNERGAARVRDGLRSGCFAIAFYSICAIVAVWLPLPIAVVLTIMWLYWVIYGARVRPSHAE